MVKSYDFVRCLLTPRLGRIIYTISSDRPDDGKDAPTCRTED